MTDWKLIQKINLTTGQKGYDYRIKNLEGIFDKIENIFDVSEYKKRFLDIQNNVEKDDKVSKDDFLSLEMKENWENIVFTSYLKELDDLLVDLEEEYIPFYELYLLYTKINIKINSINNNNIGEIILDAKSLLDIMNNLNTHNIKEKNDLFNNSYEVIYKVIIYEEIFLRSDLLMYIKSLNIPTNIENIGRILSNDLKYLNDIDLIEDNLKNLKTEGLGYDYLNPEIIRIISRKTIGETNSEYQERKREAISNVSSKIKEFSHKKDTLFSTYTFGNKEIKEYSKRKALLTAKMCSLFIFPLTTLLTGNIIGKNVSNRITEYQTITRTIDLNTGEIIGEPNEVYDDVETTYVATIMEYSPWRANPTGSGYISNVTAYEYKVPENVPDDYHISQNDLTGNILEKYKFVEPKNELEKNDSTEESTIVVIETYQNKNVNRKSTKYIIPFTIGGALLGLAIEAILILTKVYDFKEIKKRFEYLNNELQNCKDRAKTLREEITKMKDEALLIQEEYNGVVRDYGSLGDELVIPEIDTSMIYGNSRKLDKKNKNL